MKPFTVDDQKTKNMKTIEEIEYLKRNWEGDPCWDLEDTEGFEEHREELLKYSNERKAYWDERYNERIDAAAKKYGVPGNRTLAQHLIYLEDKIDKLEEKLLG